MSEAPALRAGWQMPVWPRRRCALARCSVSRGAKDQVLADVRDGGALDSLSPPLGANEGIARVRQSIDHFVQVIFEAPGQIHGLDLQRQRCLAEKFLVMGQSVIGRLAGTPITSPSKFCQRPDRFANRNEAPAGL